MPTIRVLLADDHAVLRAGLRMLISAQPDMVVVGEAADCHDARSKAGELTPDVVVLDLTMPGGSGVKTIEHLRQECPRTRVLVLSMHGDRSYIRAALAAGCAGYVVKTAADTELITAIRAVHSGRGFVDLPIRDSSLNDLLAGEAPDRSRSATTLSRRECEVLTRLAQGFTNQEIADRLFLSVKTVETHRTRIATKLGLRTRADLVRYALETGLLAEKAPPAE